MAIPRLNSTTEQTERVAAKSRWAMAVALSSSAGRKDDAVAMVERLVHGVFEGGHELALLLEEGGVRYGQQARPAAPVETERHAITGKAIGEVVHHRHGQRGQPRVLGGNGQRVEGVARPLQGLVVLQCLPAQEQRLDPANSPVELSEHPLQHRFGAFGDIEHHRSLQLPVELDRIGDDHQALGWPRSSLPCRSLRHCSAAGAR
jgi:hypothetical protein